MNIRKASEEARRVLTDAGLTQDHASMLVTTARREGVDPIAFARFLVESGESGQLAMPGSDGHTTTLVLDCGAVVRVTQGGGIPPTEMLGLYECPEHSEFLIDKFGGRKGRKRDRRVIEVLRERTPSKVDHELIRRLEHFESEVRRIVEHLATSSRWVPRDPRQAVDELTDLLIEATVSLNQLLVDSDLGAIDL